MPAIRNDIKRKLKDCGRSIVDLSRECEIEYRRLTGNLNGYWHIREEEEQRIRLTLAKWCCR